MRLLKNIVKEILYAGIIFLGATLLVYLLVSFTMHSELQINKTKVSYLSWLVSIITGNSLGYSGNWEIRDLLKDSFRLTMSLSLGAILSSTIISAVLGFLWAYYNNSKIVRFIANTFSISSALPVFLIAIFIRPFWVANFQILDWNTDVSLFRQAGYYLIPVFILSFGDGTMGEMIKFIKDSVQNISTENYVKVAIARNVSPFYHIGRSAVLPITSIIFSKFPFILGGAMLIEFIYFGRGVSVLAFEAINESPRNVDMFLAICMYFVIIVTISNLARKVLLSIMDPRVRE
ncbi:MAG: ABC transporter permease subunit [Bacillota bacterium]